MGKKSKTPAQQSSTTVTEPWKDQAPFLRDVFTQAQNQYRQNLNNTFPAQTVAPQSQATLDAQDELLNYIVPLLKGMTGDVANAQKFGLEGVLDVNNPVTQGAIQAATRPIQENLSYVALPQIQKDAILSGNLGSTRQGVAEGLAIGQTGRAIGETSANIANTAHGQALNTFIQTLGLTPQTMKSMTTPAVVGDAVGQQQRDFAQQLIDEQVSKHLFEQNKADDALATYASLVSAPQGGTSSTVGIAPAGRSSGLMGVLGGAAAGFQIGGPWGAAIGGALSLLSQ